jgi:hypothetical protein
VVDTAAEVRGSAGPGAKVIADSLDALILLVQGRTSADTMELANRVFALAEKVRVECWQQLAEGGGWPNVGWREAYAFSLLAMALVHVERHERGGCQEDGAPLEELKEAVKCLDLVIIMSGAGAAELVHTILDSIEPTVAAAGGAAGAEEDGGCEGEAASARYCIPRELPACRAPALEDKHAIPRVKRIAFGDFKKQFFKADKAVIIEGAIEDWPAMERWRDLRYLRKHFGHRTVPVELGRLQGGRKLSGWREEPILLRDFIDQHLVASNAFFSISSSSPLPATAAAQRDGALLEERNVAYLAQHALFEQLPRLQQDLVVPEYTECGELEGVNAWLGTAGTVTPLHHDSYDNLLTQVFGFKYVRLYAPSETKFLYVAKKRGSGVNAQGNLSPVECEAPDVDAFPLFRDATYSDAVLGPGDMLFIPSKHWHYVRSLSPSFSVNFWF